MTKMKTAVIGLGRIGWQFHLPGIYNHEGFELVAVVDKLEERLKEAQDQYSVRGYTSHTEMLEKENPELVVVASPTPFHVEHAIDAMEKGAHVFLDKPMAQSLEEADKIIQVMEKTRRKLMVYQPARIDSSLMTLKSILKEDYIGRVYMVKRCGTSDYMRRNDWQSLKKFGGGMLSNYGAHAIDQMLYLVGSTAKKVSCSLRSIATLGDADDVVKAIIETENDIIIDLDINRATAVPFPSFIVLGTKGSIWLESDKDDNYVFRVKYFKEEELGQLELKAELAAPGRSYRNFDKIVWHEEKVPVKRESINYYDKCYDYFVLNKEPFVPVHETREVMRILDEARDNAGWKGEDND